MGIFARSLPNPNGGFSLLDIAVAKSLIAD